jgi:FMN reductase
MSRLPPLPLRTVIVSGSGSRPSRTLALAQHIAGAVGELLPIELSVLDMADLGPELGRALHRSQLAEGAEQALRTVESAQLLIAASPVYRGSYTGHFKHLFDLIHQDALIDVPVILAATGGGDKHCLVIEHSLRPLFAFLQAFAVPVGIYAAQSDFLEGGRTTELVGSRIRIAARQAAELASRRDVEPEHAGQGHAGQALPLRPASLGAQRSSAAREGVVRESGLLRISAT